MNKKERDQLKSMDAKLDALDSKLNTMNAILEKPNNFQSGLTYTSLGVAFIALGLALPDSSVYGIIIKIIGICFMFLGGYKGFRFFGFAHKVGGLCSKINYAHKPLKKTFLRRNSAHIILWDMIDESP